MTCMVARRVTSRANPSASKVLITVVYGLEEYHRAKMATEACLDHGQQLSLSNSISTSKGMSLPLQEGLFDSPVWLVASLSLLSLRRSNTDT